MLRQGAAETEFHDIYAISLQEIVDLDVYNICFSSAETERALGEWSALLVELLCEGRDSYSILDSTAVVGTGLIVLVKSKHLQSGLVDLNRVISSSLNLGKLYTGNKAAVATRIRLANITACFVSVHFSAHRGNYASEVRSEHLLYTMKHLMFEGVEIEDSARKNHVNTQLKNTDPGMNAPLLETSSPSSEQVFEESSDAMAPPYAISSSLDVSDHDFVVLLGDMNSRMRGDVSETDVWQIIERQCHDSAKQPPPEDIVTLQSWDELWCGPMTGPLRNLGLREGKITFGPTYKLEPGSSMYHVPPADKPNKVFNHCPAWCDRILWSCRPGTSTCGQDVYCSEQVLLSDHLPVYSVFSLSVNTLEESPIDESGLRQQDAAKRTKSLRFTKQRSTSGCFGPDDSLCRLQ